MVNGFDIIGQNRTLQVHWAKRIAAFVVDCIVVLAPVWILLFLLGERRVSAYGIASGIGFFAYSTVAEAVWRKTVGKTLAGLEVRPVAGPVTLGEGPPRDIPKIFLVLFPPPHPVPGPLLGGGPPPRVSGPHPPTT